MNEHWMDFTVKRGFETLQPIYEVIGNRGYVAGSYAAFMACPFDTPVLPNDIDVFATSETNAESVARDLCNNLNFLWENDNDTVIGIGRWQAPAYIHKTSIQIVKPNPTWQTWPDDILNDFDLDICRAVLVAPDKVIGDYNIGEMYGKILRINNPLRTLKRAAKYMARGVQFNDHELLKIFLAWEQMPQERKDTMLAIANREIEYSEAPASYYSEDDWFEGE